MEKTQRAALARAIVHARFLLEGEVQDQLEGVYNIFEDGTITESAPGDPIVRNRLIQVIEHHRSTEESDAMAVARARRELAFTMLNRFVALKLAEARGIVRECVSNGSASTGIQELADCAPGLRQAFDDEGYRLLLEAVMDEVSLDVGILFDRRAATGLLWPRPKALRELLEILNDEALQEVWGSDETVGWIYQYFNADDVKEMREASKKGPRNSRELAVRNQFFTPRYVVHFLTDNTLGRLWLEMTEGRTGLWDRCQYLVYDVSRESGPEPSGDGRPPSPERIKARPRKDPREIRVLDPACGSGHFLLYAFDLLSEMYREAWASDPTGSATTDATLRVDYPERQDLEIAIPKLILRHNLHGIEIDPRCAQIASLALWLRAHRAWQELGLGRGERPQVRRTNIVVAEPIPAQPERLEAFLNRVEPPPLQDIFREIVEHLQVAGDLGSLLRIELEIQSLVEKARADLSQTTLFSGNADTGVLWESVEDQLRGELANYASQTSTGLDSLGRSMFADDAEQGVALIDVLSKRYDVVLMNPPFGDPSQAAKSAFKKAYPRTKNDIYAAFVERGLELLERRGLLGAITSRTGFFLSSFQKWREDVLTEEAELKLMVDLGLGVMDDAMVEAAAYCLEAT